MDNVLIHANNTLQEKAKWLIRHLTPGQLIETDSNNIHLFVRTRNLSTVQFVDSVWVMFYSGQSDTTNWISVLYDESIYEVSVFAFMKWFDSQGMIPKAWDDMLEWTCYE